MDLQPLYSAFFFDILDSAIVLPLQLASSYHDTTEDGAVPSGGRYRLEK